MSNFLDEIIKRKRERLAKTKGARSLEDVRREASAVRADAKSHAFREAIAGSGCVNVIAEFKRASPSKGEIRGSASPVETASVYERGGAVAISVLTEEDNFRGSLLDLIGVKQCTGLPVLRKDFIFEEYQVFESAAARADAFLLIVAALDDGTLSRLLELAERELAMDALVEVHTAEEMLRARKVGAKIIGVNNRDLRTFKVSLETSINLARLAPSDALLVSESGIRDASDIGRLRRSGYKAFLIGETLMRAASPDEALRSLMGISESSLVFEAE